MADYTPHTKLSKPIASACDWGPDWYVNQNTNDCVNQQLLRRNYVVSGGNLTYTSGLTIDMDETVFFVDGVEHTIPANTYTLQPAVQGKEQPNYFWGIDADTLGMTTDPPTAESFVMFGRIDVYNNDPDIGVSRIADLRALPLAKIDVQNALSVENDCINGLMQAWQRGVGPNTETNIILADRWWVQSNSGTIVHQQYVMTGLENVSEKVEFADSLICTALSDPVAGFTRWLYRLQGVDKYVGKTVRVEFELKAAIGAKIGIRCIIAADGTAGIPEPTSLNHEFTTNDYEVVEFEFAIGQPSTPGTIGADSYLQFTLFTNSGTNYDGAGYAVGQNFNITYYLTNVKMYASDIKLPVRRKTFAETLHECQYYYCEVYNPLESSYMYAGNNSTITYGGTIPFPREMRIVPSTTKDDGLYTNCQDAQVISSIGSATIRLTPIGAPIVYRWYEQTIKFDAEL